MYGLRCTGVAEMRRLLLDWTGIVSPATALFGTLLDGVTGDGFFIRFDSNTIGIGEPPGSPPDDLNELMAVAVPPSDEQGLNTQEFVVFARVDTTSAKKGPEPCTN